MLIIECFNGYVATHLTSKSDIESIHHHPQEKSFNYGPLPAYNKEKGIDT
jgi:hypothetical protein